MRQHVRYTDQSNRWSNPWFVLRLCLGCFLVPASFPLTLALAFYHPSQSIDDLLGAMLIYGIAGAPMMLLLGIPLLYFYLKNGFTGFVPFLTGATLCTTLICRSLQSGALQPAVLSIDALAGAVSGIVFRVLLFGFSPVMIGQRLLKNSPAAKISSSTVPGVAACAAAFSLLVLYLVADHHSLISKPMIASCESVEDRNDPVVTHTETLRLVFLENRRYEERICGPDLCSDLASARNPVVSVTFDVWSNWKTGRSSYLPKEVAISGRRSKTSGMRLGGFHPDPTTFEEYQESAPSPDRFADFPLHSR